MAFTRAVIFIFCACLTVFGELRAQCINAIASYTYNCLNSSALASVTIVPPLGVPPYTYTWLPVGVNTASAANLGVGSYTIIIKDANNCTGFTQLIIASPYVPSNIAFTTTMVTCYGGNDGAAIAVLNNSAGPPFSFTWTPGNQNTSHVSGLTAGTYSVTIKDSKGCSVTNKITIFEPKAMISVVTPTMLACPGGTVNAAITTTGGTGPFSYSLNSVPQATNIAQGIGAGMHTLTTKDSKGCIVNEQIIIDQPPPLLAAFNTSAASCKNMADGSAAVSVLGNPPPPYTYTWLPGNTNGNSAGNLLAGSHTLHIGDSKGCITKSVVVVPTLPSMSLNPVTHPENCSAKDGAYTISPTGGTAPYSFTVLPLGSTSTSSAGLSSGNYSVVITDSKTCTDSLYFDIGNLSTVTLVVTPVNSVSCYQQCNGSILMNAVNAVLPVTYSVSGFPVTGGNTFGGLCSGKYLVKVLDAAGCPATQTIEFAIPPVFSYTADLPEPVCYGKHAVLTASATGGSGSHTYVWNPGNIYGATVYVSPPATTEYSLNVYDSKGCTLDPEKVKLTVRDKLSISVPPSASGVCPGSTATIEPVVKGGDGNYTYLWLPGKLTSSFVVVENANTGFYTLSVNDGCGSPPAYKEIDIKLFPVPEPDFTVDLRKGCAPLCARFISMTPDAKQVVWNYGDKPFEQKGDTTKYCYNTEGVFSIRMTVIDSNSCKNTRVFDKFITVSGNPKIDFVTNPEIITLNNSDLVLFRSSSTGLADLKWYFNGELYSKAESFSRYFNEAGCMMVRLSARDPDGCTDSTERAICVYEGFNFYMPNAFTPDGDNLNDRLRPLGSAWKLDGYLFEVYNRWGFKLFSTTDPQEGWDGNYNDDILRSGKRDLNDSYIWRVRVRDDFGETHEFRGVAVLVR